MPDLDVSHWPVVLDPQGVAFWVAPRMIHAAAIDDVVALSQGCEVPSPDLVLAIQHAADCVLNASAFVRGPTSSPPNDYRTKGLQSVPVLENQRQRVENAIAHWEGQHGTARLVVGTHKDIVCASDHDYPHLPLGRLGIFGWFAQPSNRPIQPISSIHARGYYDYSQGLRLVRRVS